MLCGNSFSLKTTLMIADQTLQRLEVMHNKNYLHRDIKPENLVMVVFCHPGSPQAQHDGEPDRLQSITQVQGQQNAQPHTIQGELQHGRHNEVHIHIFASRHRAEQTRRPRIARLHAGLLSQRRPAVARLRGRQQGREDPDDTRYEDITHA